MLGWTTVDLPFKRMAKTSFTAMKGLSSRPYPKWPLGCHFICYD